MEQELKQKPMILYAKNELNTVPLKKLTFKEIDLFFYFCFSLNEKEAEKITLTFSDIKKVLDLKSRSIEKINKLFLRTYKKLLEVNFTIRENDKVILCPVFYEFCIDTKNKNVSIQIHPRFQHILNHFKKGNFTRINLLEIISLKLDYAKKLYPILKQFETTGDVYLRELKEWREILCIPEKYDYDLINRKILTPIIKELSKYFTNLKLIKKYSGRKITHLGFTFKFFKIETKNIVNNEIKFESKNNNYKQKKILPFNNKKTIISNDNNSLLIEDDNNIVWD